MKGKKIYMGRKYASIHIADYSRQKLLETFKTSNGAEKVPDIAELYGQGLSKLLSVLGHYEQFSEFFIIHTRNFTSVFSDLFDMSNVDKYAKSLFGINDNLYLTSSCFDGDIYSLKLYKNQKRIGEISVVPGVMQKQCLVETYGMRAFSDNALADVSELNKVCVGENIDEICEALSALIGLPLCINWQTASELKNVEVYVLQEGRTIPNTIIDTIESASKFEDVFLSIMKQQTERFMAETDETEGTTGCDFTLDKENTQGD